MTTATGNPALAAAGAGGVSLKQRAWPLVELMRHALKAGDDVLWGA